MSTGEHGRRVGDGSADLRIDRISKRFGDTKVLGDLSLAVPAGTTLAMLGPSGCGKTTLLRIVAGLETPDSGTVTVGDRTLTDGPNVVMPERRRVGLVFQDWALFPHLTVAENVAYGLRDTPPAVRRRQVAQALELVGLADLAAREPATLSGGQQQRVALARAFAPQPAVLLLDEPFSNLDATLRTQVRTEVHALLADLGITTVFVTHDQEEAFVLGDEVAVIRNGEIVQQGRPADLYNDPADRWVAEFVGDANIMAGVASGQSASTPLGAVPLTRQVSGPVQVLIRPESVVMAATGPETAGPTGMAPKAAPATVELVEFYGHDTVVFVRLAGGESVRVRTPGYPSVSAGQAVSLRYAGGDAVAFAGTVPDDRSDVTRAVM